MRAATVVQVLQDFEAPPTIAPRPPTTVANPHVDRSLGSKETHTQSHNHEMIEINCLFDDHACLPTSCSHHRGVRANLIPPRQTVDEMF